MKGRVIGVHSASEYVDGRRRVTVRVEDCDALNNVLRFADDVLQLDDEVRLGLTVVEAEQEGVENVR